MCGGCCNASYFFFFFKHKTAYEMRISDWSSDVCSSDLSLALASPPSVRNAVIAGMQAALSVLLALATMHLSPWPELVGFPALGALAALFGRYASLQRRRRILDPKSGA